MIALEDICSTIIDMGLGPRTQKLLGRDLGDRSSWALGLGPGPINIMAAHMCIKGKQYVQNIYIYICIYTYTYISMTGVK